MAFQTITPSSGNGLVPTQAGVGSAPGFDAIDFRRAWAAMYREGVLDAAAWEVTPGAGMQVSIAADVAGAYVEGDAVAHQGLYHVAPHASAITLTADAAHGSLPRVDMVVLRAYDTTHDASGLNEARVEIIAGTPSAGATTANRVGAATVPDSALRLAEFLVPAGASSPDAGSFVSYRTWAHRDGVVGHIYPAGQATARPGFLLIEGQDVSRVKYAALFTEYGTTYGSGDGASTFGLPDARGRVLVHPDGGAGRLTSNNALGATGGAEEHTLTLAEMPAHQHGMLSSGGGSGGSTQPAEVTGAVNGSTNPLTTMEGGDGAHNNTQPYQVVGGFAVFTGVV